MRKCEEMRRISRLVSGKVMWDSENGLKELEVIGFEMGHWVKGDILKEDVWV